jgi:hypothetical protein
VLVAAASAAAHLAAAARTDRLVATVGEARFAAATVATRGAELGAVPLPAADGFAVRQLAVVTTLLPGGLLPGGGMPGQGVPVVDGVRHAALALGFVSVVLLWPVLRNLGAGPVPAAVASGLVGVLPPVVALHAAVSGAAPAAVWLVLAAALVAASRRRALTAAVAAALAVLTAPLAAACLLALLAHLVHLRVVGLGLGPTARRALAAGLGVAALAVAVAAAGNGPLAGVAGPVVGLPTTLLTVGAGVGLVALTWVRHPELRPALSPALLLLAVAVVPGAARAAALLLVLPFLAVAVATLLDPVVSAVPAPRRAAVAAVPLTALALVLVVGLLSLVGDGSAATPATRPANLAAWAGSELAPDVVLHADPLDRAELLVNGVAPERLRDLGEPAGAGELVMVTERPTNGVATLVPPPCVTAVARVARGNGGSPTAVCPAVSAEPAAAAAEQAVRARFGGALTRNPALDLAPPAAAALRAGIVDPRVVLVLADLAGPRRLAIADFPVVPHEPAYALRRRVLLSAVDGMPAAGEPQPLVRTWLSSQQPPFVPSMIEAHGSDLLVAYPAPTPTGLLTG